MITLRGYLEITFLSRTRASRSTWHVSWREYFHDISCTLEFSSWSHPGEPLSCGGRGRTNCSNKRRRHERRRLRVSFISSERVPVRDCDDKQYIFLWTFPSLWHVFLDWVPNNSEDSLHRNIVTSNELLSSSFKVNKNGVHRVLGVSRHLLSHTSSQQKQQEKRMRDGV